MVLCLTYHYWFFMFFQGWIDNYIGLNGLFTGVSFYSWVFSRTLLGYVRLMASAVRPLSVVGDIHAPFSEGWIFRQYFYSGILCQDFGKKIQRLVIVQVKWKGYEKLGFWTKILLYLVSYFYRAICYSMLPDNPWTGSLVHKNLKIFATVISFVFVRT